MTLRTHSAGPTFGGSEFFTMFEPIEQTTKAFDEYAIVTSATKDKSYWVDETSEL